MRVAAIDCGTNSIRLLIAEEPADSTGGPLRDLVRHTRIVRLGAGVDRTGRLAPEALDRTRAALVDYTAEIRAAGVDAVRMVATSATRDAANRSDFVAMVRSVLGADPEVISGDEEAALSFAGAAGALPGATGPMLVADIGGGSTELVGNVGGPITGVSMDVGCVRLSERHLHDDPATPAQVEQVVSAVRVALHAARDVVPTGPRAHDATFVGVAGTVTTIVGIALGLPAYDSIAIHGARISAAQVRTVTADLVGMTRARRTALPVMHPGRVDVIVAGALILRTLVDEFGVDTVVASEHDILDGIARSLLAESATPS